MARLGRPITVTPQILLRAYAAGLFPMAESAEDPSLFWLDPEKRGVFPLRAMRISQSLAKTVRSDRFEIVVDRDFAAVVEACAAPDAGRPQTWINGTIRQLFGELFTLGHVHTVEAYQEGELVGGLYGASLGGAFFGESMFHHRRDASKVCLVHLAGRLVAGGYSLLDTQFITPHLESLGAVEIPRGTYRKLLAAALAQQGDFFAWPKTSVPGRHVLEVLRA